MGTLYRAVSIGAILALGILTGCASEEVAHVESITGAESAVRQAQDSGAAANAPLQLKIAEDKLTEAKAAAAKEEFRDAKKLADEALVDAQLAEAESLSIKAKKQSRDMRESIETLRRELERKQAEQ